MLLIFKFNTDAEYSLNFLDGLKVKRSGKLLDILSHTPWYYLKVHKQDINIFLTGLTVLRARISLPFGLI